KTAPLATAMTLATTMSTTRQRSVRRGVDEVVVVLVTCRALSLEEMARDVEIRSSLRWHDPDQVRRSKLRSASSQPGSPDSRVPIQYKWEAECMDFRIFTEPQQGASYEELLAVA